MDLLAQLDQGIIVSPVSKKRLKISENADWLITEDLSERYPLYHGTIPILLENPEAAERDIDSAENMKTEYSPEALDRQSGCLQLFKGKLLQGCRNLDSDAAFSEIFDTLSEDAICLSVGGGPGRSHPKLINLNIGPFPNVEVVADAHYLPYADESVDAIYCEAVLEHLRNPPQAVREMLRILKRGGKLFSGTPFLQQYHGYPHHYQNFTLTGHKYLYESGGFEVLKAGVRFGPFYTFVDLTFSALRNYVPAPIRWPFSKLFTLLSIVLLRLDRYIYSKDNAYILASSTFVVAQKRTAM